MIYRVTKTLMPERATLRHKQLTYLINNLFKVPYPDLYSVLSLVQQPQDPLPEMSSHFLLVHTSDVLQLFFSPK